MSDKTLAEIIETVYSKLPESNTISDLKLYPSSIRFNWRGKRFVVNSTLFVEEVSGGCLSMSNAARSLRLYVRSLKNN